MTRAPVRVLDHAGREVGTVAATATSIGAAKLAKAPCDYRRVNGVYVWQAKQESKS